mgnify:CR=1 FL=1
MTRQTQRISLPSPSAGTDRYLLVHRYGAAEAQPKAYIQASLHADETPGMLVAHHLLRKLDAAAAQGAVSGQIVVVPYANPIGLSQSVNGYQLGRYDLAGGGNFNRSWPDLASLIGERVSGHLGEDAAVNIAAIRAALRESLAETRAAKALDQLRLTLAREACDADLILDLHCDDEALSHLFLLPQHWPEAQDLAAELGSRAVMLAEDSGGASFDEAFSGPWLKLARMFPDNPIPPACLAATVELRGFADVSNALAESDAQAIFRVLQRRGFIAGDPGPLPALQCEATMLDATDSVKAASAGILVYTVLLGAEVEKGQLIAELVDPAAENPASARRAIHAGTDGLVLSRRGHKFVTPGQTVAKIVGRESLPHRTGYLLED